MMNLGDSTNNTTGDGGAKKKRRRRGGRRHRKNKPEAGTGVAGRTDMARDAGGDFADAPPAERLLERDDEFGVMPEGGLPGGKKRRRRGGRRHRRKGEGAAEPTPVVAAAKPPEGRQPRRQAQPTGGRPERPPRGGRLPRGEKGRRREGRAPRREAGDPRLLPGAADVLAELGQMVPDASGKGDLQIAPLELVIPDMQVRKMSPAQRAATSRPDRGPRDFRPQGEDRLRLLLPATDDFSLYTITGPSPLKRLVASMPETRLLLNRPEIVGGQVTVALRGALARLLARAGQELGIAGRDDRGAAILNFMRGGLAFGLREALTESAGLNRATQSLAVVERYRDGHTWKVRKDGYRDLRMPDNAHLFLAEVVASGTTLAHGLDQLIDELKRARKTLSGITVFAVGSGKAEDVLAKAHERCRHEFGRHYGQTTLVYFEGRFGLAGAVKSPVISESGRDLLRFPALLAPEFELSQFERMSYPLERCAIYDLGTRAFSPVEHLGQVKDFWRQLMEQGITFEEAYRERWPLRPQSGLDIATEYARLWQDPPETTLAALAEARTKLWALLDTEGKTRAALIRACCQRISELEKLMA